MAAGDAMPLHINVQETETRVKRELSISVFTLFRPILLVVGVLGVFLFVVGAGGWFGLGFWGSFLVCLGLFC